MKKYLILFLALCIIQPVFATLADENEIQSKIDYVGTKLLNTNKIQKRIIFTYDANNKKNILSSDKTLTQRQIVIYDGLYQSVQNEDELAGMLARQIAIAVKSYRGIWGGLIDSAQVALSSKKFELYADKRAVDYMVNAGYDPLGLIVFINKTAPQKRSDIISRHNLTSKRLARIYEYIYFKYPDYLSNTTYLDNQYYQNFLLNSVDNRKKLYEKIENKSTKDVKYE